MACVVAACSVRLLGLHHSLYEHPVKVEVTTPSDRSDMTVTHKPCHIVMMRPCVTSAPGSLPSRQPLLSWATVELIQLLIAICIPVCSKRTTFRCLDGRPESDGMVDAHMFSSPLVVKSLEVCSTAKGPGSEVLCHMCRGTDHFSYSLANDRAAHMALHEAQRQLDSASSSDQAATTPPAVKSHPAEPHSSTQQQETAGGQLHTSQSQQQQSPDQQTQQPGSSQPAGDATITPFGMVTPGAKAVHGSQQQGEGQEQPAMSGVSTPTGASLPGSVSKQDLQQQLLQQLAAQAGFQLVSPPSQSAGSAAQAAMQQAEQGGPVQAALPQQQQQQWAALGHAGVSQGLSHELSHGLLQQLGQGLQSSAMQMASMQQQQQVQQQSRLPAWAQQALMPDHTPTGTPPTPYYGMPGLSPAHSMHPLHSPPAHGLPDQYVNVGGMHEQYGSAGMRTSLSGGSWQLPAWQQQQQPQATPQWMLDQHTQQYSTITPPVGSLDHSALHGFGHYQTPHGGSPLDLTSSHAAAFWSTLGHSGADMGTPAHPQGQHMPPMIQSQASNADSLQSQGSLPGQQQGSRADSLPAVMQDDHSAKASKLSPLDPDQAKRGFPSVLSGGSSGVSSPLRESGHLESLVEVNDRVEAAMGRARSQLQVRIWPSTI